MPMPSRDEYTEWASFAIANDFIEQMEKLGISDSTKNGTIAVATKHNDKAPTVYYIAFSSETQRTLTNDNISTIIKTINKNREKDKNSKIKLVLCCFVEGIVSKLPSYKTMVNKGCAEKKIMSYLASQNSLVGSICVRPFPDLYGTATTVKYEDFGGAHGGFCTPCDSCNSLFDEIRPTAGTFKQKTLNPKPHNTITPKPKSPPQTKQTQPIKTANKATTQNAYRNMFELLSQDEET